MKSKISIALLIIVLIGLTGCLGLPEPETCTSNDDCSNTRACDDGKCRVCGTAEGRVCCRDDWCEEGLECLDNECKRCGGNWQHCCLDSSCNEFHECSDDGYCHECGEVGRGCCEGGVCQGEGNYGCNSDDICRPLREDGTPGEEGEFAAYGSGIASRG